jgi:phospholipid/cholesterol/gamma-HCH transport system permease protein
MFLIRYIRYIGKAVFDFINFFDRITKMFFEALVYIFKGQIEWKEFLKQCIRIGNESLPMVGITGFFVGAVLVVQTGTQFIRMGAENYVGGVVALSLARELAPILTAIVVAGRIGAALAAELGSMKVTEQIYALYTLATNPIQYLIVPRLLASFFMLPVLIIYSNFVGLIGGYVIAVNQLDMSTITFFDSIVVNLRFIDLIGGVCKGFFFGIIISLIGCYMGFYTEGGAEGVGKSTTNAVVSSIVFILIVNLFLTMLIINVFDQLFGVLTL